MTSRERVLTALDHREPDRVPIDLGGCSVTLIHQAAHRSLAEYLGLTDPQEKIHNLMTMQVFVEPRIQERFRADVLLLQPGKPDSWELSIDAATGMWVDEWGNRYKKPPGVLYYEWDRCPLAEVAGIDGLKRYRWPDARDPGRYRGMEERARQLSTGTDKAILVNSAFGIWEQYLTLRGVENALADVAGNVRFLDHVLSRLLEWLEIYYEEMLSRVGRYVQVVKIDDDLGWTGGMFFSPETYRALLKPKHRELIRFIKARTDARIFMHSDGSVHDVIPDLIDVGVDALNPVEVTAAKMDSRALKKEFGSELSFWGGGCNNNILERGTPEEVEQEVIRRINDLSPGGGFVFASIHCIQPFVPPRNIVSFFDSAFAHGGYSPSRRSS